MAKEIVWEQNDPWSCTAQVDASKALRVWAILITSNNIKKMGLFNLRSSDSADELVRKLTTFYYTQCGVWGTDDQDEPVFSSDGKVVLINGSEPEERFELPEEHGEAMDWAALELRWRAVEGVYMETRVVIYPAASGGWEATLQVRRGSKRGAPRWFVSELNDAEIQLPESFPIRDY